MPAAPRRKRKYHAQPKMTLGLRKKEAMGGSFVDIDRIRSGFSDERFDMAARKLGLSRFELARKLRIAPRTLATRKGKTLSALESEKTFRAERIFDEAAEVFGSIDEARIWMNSPQRGLENQNPSDLLDTDLGAGHVQNYLSAIKYGNVW